MARSDRLLRLLQAIRTFPPPVTAAVLARETGVSERTLYRDINSLRLSGVLIDGSPGYGYCLTEDPSLPPQNFSRLEIEALVLGLGYVRSRGDAALAEAGQLALSKITATLPERLQRQVAHAVLKVYRPCPALEEPDGPTLELIREASWSEMALDMRYLSATEQRTERRIFPLSVVYLEESIMLLAWCRLRRDFRMFRVSRILDVAPSDESFQPRRASLLREYLQQLASREDSARL
ncbi:helix-turn-helix transcriptional regulator [Granulosicoccus sp. 3-233]|uniref:helix-turn-helix transcriptional regulator n=1 Tax=Granulosicoccus sp. 3-233 TaxID=3417969 RepID=UPI003D3528A4